MTIFLQRDPLILLDESSIKAMSELSQAAYMETIVSATCKQFNNNNNNNIKNNKNSKNHNNDNYT